MKLIFKLIGQLHLCTVRYRNTWPVCSPWLLNTMGGTICFEGSICFEGRPVEFGLGDQLFCYGQSGGDHPRRYSTAPGNRITYHQKGIMIYVHNPGTVESG